MNKRAVLAILISFFVMTFFTFSGPVMAKSSSKTSSKSTKSKSKKTTKQKKSKTKKSKAKNKAATKNKAKATSKRKRVSKSKNISKSKRRVQPKTGPININTADAKTLTALTGIGPVTAKKIVAYRRKNGKFRTAADLMNVKGIGEKTMKKMKPRLKF